jgi:hypothetical protein
MSNDTFDQATPLSDFRLEKQYFSTDSVGPDDLDDYYKFYTGYGPSQLYAVLNGLSADADLYIYDHDHNLIASSTNGGTDSERINTVSLQGYQDYYIRVHDFVPTNSTNYGLFLINDYAGSTLDTARDNGISWGQSSNQNNNAFYNDYLDYRDNDNQQTGALFFDIDGKGGATQVQIAKLSTGLALTHNDIVVAA